MAHHMNGIPQIAYTRVLLDVPMKSSDSVEDTENYKYPETKETK
jgi:hypothetical protein